MTTPNPFPRHELPDQRRGQLRSHLIAEVMRDDRADSRRRPVLTAVTSAAAVGTLAVGAVFVGAQVTRQTQDQAGTRATKTTHDAGPSVSPSVTGSPSPSASPSTSAVGGGAHGSTSGCDGMVLTDSPAVDDLRYLPRQPPTGYALPESWSTVLDADCTTPSNTMSTPELFTRSASRGHAAGVVAISTVGDSAGIPEPSPTSAVTGADGISVAAGGRGSFVANFGHLRVETAGLSAEETLAVARLAKNSGGQLPPGSPLLVGWTSATIPGPTPGAGRENWYARFQLAGATVDGPDINYEVHRRTANDNANEAFWDAAGVPTIDLGGHRAIVLDNGSKGVRFVSVALTPTVVLMLQAPGGNGVAVQTARDLVSSLEKVAADDPRIVRPVNTPSPSLTR